MAPLSRVPTKCAFAPLFNFVFVFEAGSLYVDQADLTHRDLSPRLGLEVFTTTFICSLLRQDHHKPSWPLTFYIAEDILLLPRVLGLQAWPRQLGLLWLIPALRRQR